MTIGLVLLAAWLQVLVLVAVLLVVVLRRAPGDPRTDREEPS